MSDIAIDDIEVTEGDCPAPKPKPKIDPCAIKCLDGKTCVPSDKICDFYNDCKASNPLDNTDEAHCDGCDFEKG
jgi:hypothetical protein